MERLNGNIHFQVFLLVYKSSFFSFSIGSILFTRLDTIPIHQGCIEKWKTYFIFFGKLYFWVSKWSNFYSWRCSPATTQLSLSRCYCLMSIIYRKRMWRTNFYRELCCQYYLCRYRAASHDHLSSEDRWTSCQLSLLLLLQHRQKVKIEFLVQLDLCCHYLEDSWRFQPKK